MLRGAGVCLLAAALVVLLLSCTKVEQWATPEEGGLAIEKLANLNTIPSKWGNFVQVSQDPYREDHFQLWFQDYDGNVRVVTFDTDTNRLLPNARLIQRK